MKRIDSSTRNGFPRALRRRAMVLLIVLMVIAAMTLAGMTFAELMLTERHGTDVSVARAQARASAESGVEAARFLLSLDPDTQTQAGGWYNNPAFFQGVLMVDSQAAPERCRFTVIAPVWLDGAVPGIRYGLEDESGRLNLNTLLKMEEGERGSRGGSGGGGQSGGRSGGGGNSDDQSEDGQDQSSSPARDVLMQLPGMTEDTADAILDWIDPDDEPREFGAESEYYSTLVPPYTPKNGPLETIEELLLVRGVTPALLFGTDANRNGLPDPDEPSPDMLQGLSTNEVSMARGWSAYLTLYSLESNLRADGTPKINVNQDDAQALFEELDQALGTQAATFVVAYRQFGSYSGTKSGTQGAVGELDMSRRMRTRLKSVLDLVGGRVEARFQGQRSTTVLESPFPDDSGSMTGYLPELMDNLATDDKPVTVGRININQAPRAVLAGIPGMTDELLEAILSQRIENPADAPPEYRYATWLLADGLATLDEMKQLMPYVTGAGSMYRAQVVGYFDQSGPAVRVEAVIDASEMPPRPVFVRDLSHLGRGYALETLGVEAAPAPTP